MSKTIKAIFVGEDNVSMNEITDTLDKFLYRDASDRNGLYKNWVWNSKNIDVSDECRTQDIWSCELPTPQQYIPGKDVVILCFNLTDRNSYTSIQNSWLPDAKKLAPNAKLILVGTKLDQCNPQEKNSRKITTNEATIYAKSNGIATYIECSLENGDSLNKICEAITSRAGTPKRSHPAFSATMFKQQPTPPTEHTPLTSGMAIYYGTN